MTGIGKRTVWHWICSGLVVSISFLPVLVYANTISIPGRLVVDVLSEYQEIGYEFLYSTGVVRKGLRFTPRPDGDQRETSSAERTTKPGAQIAALNSALAKLNLKLVEDAPRAYRIVPTPVTVAKRLPLLKGKVVDAESGEPVVGALVTIGQQSMETDPNGEFLIPPEIGFDLTFSHDDYVGQRVQKPDQSTSPFEISLARSMSLEEMVVVSSRYAVNDSRTRSQLIDLELLESIPRLGEDPIRIASHLPGMATIGVSAKPHIRGGLQDEVLVLFNNVELLEPFHLRDFQSIFSSFNPSVVETIDVYTGGFPVRYGDRMSGVMDINPGNSLDESSGEVSVSLLNLSAMLHGDVQQGRGNWAVSVRRGNLDIVTKQINSTVGEPSYSDAYAQFRYEINPATELDVGFIAYNDDIELSDFDSDGEIASSKYKNIYGWGQIHRDWNLDLSSTTLAYWGSIKHDRTGFLLDEDLDNGTASVDDSRNFNLLALNQSFSYRINDKAYLEFGAKITHQAGEYDYAANIERGVLAELLGNQVSDERLLRLRPKGDSGGVYLSLRGEPTQGVALEGGVRWDYQDYGLGASDDQVSPRFSARWKVTDHSQIRLSVGRFFQAEGIHELQVGDGETRFQDAQYSDHVILSWYQDIGPSFSLRTEFFDKAIHDPKRRYENLFNPLVLLPELASDRIAVAPSRAHSRGYEVTAKYDPGRRFMSWLSYSRSEVEDRIDGQWSPRVWDQGHTVSAGFSWEGDRWQLGATLLWHDGWRTTRLPSEVAQGEIVDFKRNGHRLRDYFSLDVLVSRTWRWSEQSLTAFLEVTNSLSRRNVGGVELDIGEEIDDGETIYEIETGHEDLLPLVPSIGVRWRF
ncbi:MAG: TonB-dependent receptor plug domain-containing protein [Pseudomonadales bacterium]|nr:TonB-dependent receptor plug domain-containing protein [Pseudomonadales bacterium]